MQAVKKFSWKMTLCRARSRLDFPGFFLPFGFESRILLRVNVTICPVSRTRAQGEQSQRVLVRRLNTKRYRACTSSAMRAIGHCG